MLTKNEALGALRLLTALPVWLAGGVAADFHVGRWTRDHHDIDLLTFDEHRESLAAELVRLGFTQTDDRGWITHWTRSGVDVSLACEERVDDVTGRLVIRREHAADGVVPGVYPAVPGNLDEARYAQIDDVRFRAVSAEDEPNGRSWGVRGAEPPAQIEPVWAQAVDP